MRNILPRSRFKPITEAEHQKLNEPYAIQCEMQSLMDAWQATAESVLIKHGYHGRADYKSWWHFPAEVISEPEALEARLVAEAIRNARAALFDKQGGPHALLRAGLLLGIAAAQADTLALEQPLQVGLKLSQGAAAGGQTRSAKFDPEREMVRNLARALLEGSPERYSAWGGRERLALDTVKAMAREHGYSDDERYQNLKTRAKAIKRWLKDVK